jgi:hypothetical protein
MKEQLKNLALLLIAVPILFIGCKKSDMNDNAQNTKDNTLKSIVYCGSTTTGILYAYFDTEHTPYGTVTVGNDLNNVYVTYTLASGWSLIPASDNWAYRGCYLFVGSEAELEADPLNYLYATPNEGHFNFEGFARQYPPAGSGETTYQFVIPRSEVTVGCPMIVAFAAITNGTVNQYVSARSQFKGSGYWFTHCIQNCPVITCNTAYAKGNGPAIANCFYNSPISLNNWGWSNKITPSIGAFSWPMYAGNPSCNALHEAIGTFSGSYNGTTLTVKYDLLPGFTLDESHLWVGVGEASNTNHPLLPWKSKQNVYIASPGQYTYNNVFQAGVSKSFPYSGTLYLAAHAKVCGEYAW